MNKYISTVIIMFFFTLVYGKQIDEAKAKKIGLNFLFGVTNFQSKTRILNLEMVFKANSQSNFNLRSSLPNTSFFIFNIDQSGYIIIAGDDSVTPILAYSDQNKFEPDNIPDNVASWLEEYEKQIQYIIDNKIEPTAEIIKTWDLLINGHKENPSERKLSGV